MDKTTDMARTTVLGQWCHRETKEWVLMAVRILE